MISYDVPAQEVVRWVRGGLSLLKIKIGSNPGGGDAEQMLRWDSRRLGEIHRAVADIQAPGGRKALYYLDANGRYDSKDRLKRLLDHAEQIGALDRILLLEEPFSPDNRLHVSDIPVRLAIDESYHNPADVQRLIQTGYRCVALKPAAKTLTVSLRAARAAYDADVPCFCADLTVNPTLLEWNRNVAARLAPLPGLSEGILESNGPQNYRDWNRLKSYHPRPNARWVEAPEGCYELDEEFYTSSGCLFEPSEHYGQLVSA
jgi:L-alanine-DL-glutamate epimerase-like enolase superfamily enzyme